MALNPGDTLNNNHYRIVRQLGRGGFGFVYLAHDALLGEEVAIKELIPALVGDEAMLKRFLAEARATMRLTHKHIVRTHNVFQEGGNYYIIMEYMAGGSLEEHLRSVGSLSVDDVVRVAAEVCDGLACAHEERVVHCDLKPANILFDAAGHAKVADFGIAHVSGEMLTRSWMTPSGFVAGTLPYMAPEQADGVRDDPRIDIYAVGAVLYRALTGQTYLGFDPQETPRAQAENVGRIYSEHPSPPSHRNSTVPPWLDMVVLKALDKRPEQRYPSMQAMRAALFQQQPAPVPAATPSPVPLKRTPPPVPVRVSAPPSPPGPSSPPTGAGPVTRSPALPAWFWPAAGAAVVLLVLLVVGIVALSRGRDGGSAAVGGGTAGTPVEAAAAGVALAGTPEQAATPTATETPRPTPTDTPQPTATFTSTATDTPTPTATPTNTPVALATQVRERDGMVMVYVPAGEFLMGSRDADAADNGKTLHTVSLDAYWIDETEVTNAQFRLCVEAGACEAPTTCDRGEPTYDNAAEADHPVVCVDWQQAAAYCEWAGARLPTEAEWEKAARGIDERRYPWGDIFDGSKVNFCDRNCEFAHKDIGADDHSARTAPVGSYPYGISPYGALDMAGNVWEWTADWYAADYYPDSPEKNPKGPDSGSHRALRGGGWDISWQHVRADARNYYYPTNRAGHVGFRCADSTGE